MFARQANRGQNERGDASGPIARSALNRSLRDIPPHGLAPDIGGAVATQEADFVGACRTVRFGAEIDEEVFV